MSEGERQVFAIKLCDDWLEADMADSLEMYCYEQGRADAIEEFLNKVKELYPNDSNALYKLMCIAEQLKEKKNESC